MVGIGGIGGGGDPVAVANAIKADEAAAVGVQPKPGIETAQQLQQTAINFGTGNIGAGVTGLMQAQGAPQGFAEQAGGLVDKYLGKGGEQAAAQPAAAGGEAPAAAQGGAAPAGGPAPAGGAAPAGAPGGAAPAGGGEAAVDRFIQALDNPNIQNLNDIKNFRDKVLQQMQKSGLTPEQAENARRKLNHAILKKLGVAQPGPNGAMKIDLTPKNQQLLQFLGMKPDQVINAPPRPM